ncbi:MAG TPA: hypothetical protein VFL99_15005, partial [Segeticoccus sp.]|nr:hypothetical protein [Segeticoccus sp.]
IGIAVACTAAAAAGYAAAHATGSDFRAVIDGFAAGALLVMLVDSMVPEAARAGGEPAGLVTVIGFSLAAALSAA